jgi:hypothetical protein
VAQFEGLEFDMAHGFQNQDGFTVDSVVGKLELVVVKCHSRFDAEPRERVVMVTPDERIRVHDYVAIRRAHGKMIVGDVWTFGSVTTQRVLKLLERILVPFAKAVGARLLESLARKRLPF